ncbi:flavin reductase [Streptomyces sp. ATCC 21386]|uniref:flavin reductase n=1 Tax=Streptomyces sp. ATCC 21386 TaxID=2699428 RepID=UPI002044DD94|nr:flavin reductase [Streptomyces sp. ATCC 21386]
MKLCCIPCGDEPDHSLSFLTAALGPEVEIVTIEPGGPGDREDDRSYRKFTEAVDIVVDRLRRQVGDAPYAVYGCGRGGLIGYEAARRLVGAGHRSPRHMFVFAGARPPGRCGQDASTGERTRPDLTFLSALVGAVCVPEEFLEFDDDRSCAGPRTRGDREWSGRYGEADRALPLGCPVTMFTGDEEAGDAERDAELWARLTMGPVTRLKVSGGPHTGDGRAVGIAERMRSVLLGDGPAAPVTAVTAEVFREAMSHLASPVTVVTATGDDGKPRAFTASAVCSLSAEPPLLLVCMNRTGSTHDVFAAAGRFLINVLTDEQADVAIAFARHERAAAEAGLVPLEGGVPGVPGASARFLCAREHVLPGGDHNILVGRLETVSLTGAPPLIHYRRGWHRPSSASADRSPDPRSQLV